MIATALALQEATQEAVHDPMVVDMARDLFESRLTSDEDEFIRKVYRYSALLASLTTAFATNVLLTESQINEMMSGIEEMQQIGKDIE